MKKSMAIEIKDMAAPTVLLLSPTTDFRAPENAAIAVSAAVEAIVRTIVCSALRIINLCICISKHVKCEGALVAT